MRGNMCDALALPRHAATAARGFLARRVLRARGVNQEAAVCGVYMFRDLLLGIITYQRYTRLMYI